MVGRPGVSLARVSLARSLRPITMTGRREVESAATAAIEPAFKIAFGVSIIAQMRVVVGRAGFPQSPRGGHDRARPVDLGQEDGVRPGGRSGNEIILAPWRMRPVDADDDLPAAEAAGARRLGDLPRAATFWSGATKSSRSRISASAANVLAFANALALEPGM